MKTVLLIDDNREFRGHRLRMAQRTRLECARSRRRRSRPATRLASPSPSNPVRPADAALQWVSNFAAFRSQEDNVTGTAIIVTTGSGYATDRMNALEAGADDYLVKPINFTNLARVLDRFTDGAHHIRPAPMSRPTSERK